MYIYLQSETTVNMKQMTEVNQPFRHYFTHPDQDITVSLTVYAGQPKLFISLNPEVKTPNMSKHDFSSEDNKMISGIGSVISINSTDFIRLNKFCRTDYEQKVQTEPCAMFANIICYGATYCKYSISLRQDNREKAELIKLGIPIHALSRSEGYKYYYLMLEGTFSMDILISLQTDGKSEQDENDIEMVVALQDSPLQLSLEQWEFPIRNDSIAHFKREGQELIKISKEDLIACWKQSSDKSIALIVGVYSTGNSSIIEPSKFTLVAYTDIIRLPSQQQTQGIVAKGQFQYYQIDSYCDNCTIMITLQSLSTGNPDLYVKYGDHQLPTELDFDFKSSTVRTEILNINFDDHFFVENKINTMRGPYIIGVFGSAANSTFVISFNQENFPIYNLVIDKGLKSSQKAFQTIFYIIRPQQFERKSEIKISVSLKMGRVDMFVTTFNETYSDSFYAKLQQVVAKPLRSLKNLRPTSSIQDTQISFKSQDGELCKDCFYIVAVLTQDVSAQYLIIMSGNQKSQLAKIGEYYQSQISTAQTLIYRFLITDYQDITIIWNAPNIGQINCQLTFDPTGEGSIIKDLSNISSFILKKDDPQFLIDQTYYLIFSNQGSQIMFGVMISQELTIHHLTDGIQQKLVFNSPKDVSKYMAISLPRDAELQTGEEQKVSVQVLVKATHDHLHPQLFVKFLANLDQELSDVHFPKGDTDQDMTNNFDECFNWDYRLQVMLCTFTFVTTSHESGLALNLYESSAQRATEHSVLTPEVLITVSTSSIMRLHKDQAFTGELQHHQSFQLYQVDESVLQNQDGYLMIEISQCKGLTLFQFSSEMPSSQKSLSEKKMPQNDSKIEIAERHTQYGRDYYFIQLPLKSLVIQATPLRVFNAAKYEVNEGDEAINSYIIKVKHNKHIKIKNNHYYLQNNGHIMYDFVEDYQRIQLTWGNLSYTDVKGEKYEFEDPQFIVVLSMDETAHLQSQCAITIESTDRFNLNNFHTSQTTLVIPKEIEAGQRYYFNVFAKIKPANEVEYDYIPYSPVTVIAISPDQVPDNSVFMQILIALLIIILIILTFLIWICKRTTTRTKQRLDEVEMTQVARPSSSSGTENVSSAKKNESGVKKRAVVKHKQFKDEYDFEGQNELEWSQRQMTGHKDCEDISSIENDQKGDFDGI